MSTDGGDEPSTIDLFDFGAPPTRQRKEHQRSFGSAGPLDFGSPPKAGRISMSNNSNSVSSMTELDFGHAPAAARPLNQPSERLADLDFGGPPAPRLIEQSAKLAPRPVGESPASLVIDFGPPPAKWQKCGSSQKAVGSESGAVVMDVEMGDESEPAVEHEDEGHKDDGQIWSESELEGKNWYLVSIAIRRQ